MRHWPLSSLLVLLFASPSLAQRLGPELDVAAPLTVSTAGSQTGVFVASDGDHFFVFYVDRTTAYASSHGLLLAEDGTVLADLGNDWPTITDLACNAAGCAAITSAPSWNAGVLRFAHDGTRTDAAPIDLGLSGTSRGMTRIDALPAGFGIASSIQTTEGTAYVSYRTIGTSGALGTPIHLADGGNEPFVDVACGPSSCLVGWRAATGVVGRRIDPSGAPLDASAFAIAPTTATPTGLAIAWNVARWMVLDSTAVLIPNYQLRGHRVEASGSVGPAIDLGSGVPPDAPLGIECLADGSCLVGGCSFGTCSGMLLAVWPADDVVLSGTTVPWVRYYDPVFACGPTHCLAARPTESRTNAFVLLTIADEAIVDQRALELGVGADVLYGPVAVAGSMAVLQRRTGLDAYALMALPLDATGAPDGEPRTIGTSARAYDAVSLVRADDAYGVLSNGVDGPELRTLASDGSLRDGPTPLGSGSSGALAWNGTSYLAVWAEPSRRVVTQRLNAIAERVDALPRALGTAMGGAVAVANDATDGFVVLVAGYTDERAYRVHADGSSEAAGTLVRDRSTGGVERAALSRGASGWLAAWVDTSDYDPATGARTYEVRATRLSETLEVLDLGGRVVAAPRYPRELAVGFVGPRWMVAWTGLDDASTTRLTNVRAFGEDGTLGTAVSVDESASNLYTDWPFDGPSGLAVGGTAPVVIYGDTRTELDYVPFRVAMRRLTDDVVGASCTITADCASGFCADGVCCESACDGPCEACGASGVCGPAAAGTTCRVAATACDLDETCDGASTTCPADENACDGGTAPPDAAVVTDAGVSGDDASVAPDASTPPPPASSGCSVALSSRSGALALQALVLVAMLVWRHRRIGRR